VVGNAEVDPRLRSVNTIRIRLGHESLDVTLAYLKGKDAESEEAQEHANSSSLAVYITLRTSSREISLPRIPSWMNVLLPVANASRNAVLGVAIHKEFGVQMQKEVWFLPSDLINRLHSGGSAGKLQARFQPYGQAVLTACSRRQESAMATISSANSRWISYMGSASRKT
jgi:hypothetical protein